ncbi:hypothetical protein RF11_10685 [Thelohanellus kitauei]|uniref:Uncharacterized protein n=1 Tax=Thelohanellus kitauei TaxID=669202 RepID=A0A0C2MPZ2_THEKT|nr:hypothetical protein RF11_10685 [Thelohanellus kitauei]
MRCCRNCCTENIVQYRDFYEHLREEARQSPESARLAAKKLILTHEGMYSYCERFIKLLLGIHHYSLRALIKNLRDQDFFLQKNEEHQDIRTSSSYGANPNEITGNHSNEVNSFNFVQKHLDPFSQQITRLPAAFHTSKSQILNQARTLTQAQPSDNQQIFLLLESRPLTNFAEYQLRGINKYIPQKSMQSNYPIRNSRSIMFTPIDEAVALYLYGKHAGYTCQSNPNNLPLDVNGYAATENETPIKNGANTYCGGRPDGQTTMDVLSKKTTTYPNISINSHNRFPPPHQKT